MASCQELLANYQRLHGAASQLPGDAKSGFCISKSCQELPGAARSCQELPPAAKTCQEYPEATKRYQKQLPGATRNYQELPMAV